MFSDYCGLCKCISMLRMMSLPVYRTKKRAFYLLFLPLFFYLAAFPSISAYVTDLLMSQKKAQIENYLTARSNEVQAMIQQQIEQLQFDCSAHDWQVIRDPRYYSHYIRFMGIATKEGKQCSTLGYPLQLNAPNGLDKGERHALSLAVTPDISGTKNELTVQFAKNGHTAVWVLDSSWMQSKLNHPCLGCFYFEARFSNHSPTSYFIQRGNDAILNEMDVLSLNLTVKGMATDSTLVLWAGQALKQHVMQNLLIWGTPLSLLLGGILMLSYWLIRNYRNSIEGLIEKGIRDHEFLPYYQPIVDSRSKAIVGYEVLLRWQKGAEVIPPSVFIDTAESTGLIFEITDQLMNIVLHDLQSLPPAHWVSINLVAEHIENGHLSKFLSSLNWPEPNRIKFELTERNPIKNLAVASDEITLMMKKGYQFKIDDFGTGYGGFSYLQHLHIRSIKIDKMFVDTIETDDVKKSVLDSIIASAKAGNIELIAEGAETFNQVDYLAEKGVFLIQGYVYAKAMQLHEILNKLSDDAWVVPS